MPTSQSSGAEGYELVVHALSPLRPRVSELLGTAAESGLLVEPHPSHPCPDPESDDWSRLQLRPRGVGGAAMRVEALDDPEPVLESLRAERAAGENVPEQALDATVLYRLELPGGLDSETEEGEARAGAFVAIAWALASRTDGVVFDPQEAFFADADSFLALLLDETAFEGHGDAGDAGMVKNSGDMS